MLLLLNFYLRNISELRWRDNTRIKKYWNLNNIVCQSYKNNKNLARGEMLKNNFLIELFIANAYNHYWRRE